MLFTHPYANYIVNLHVYTLWSACLRSQNQTLIYSIYKRVLFFLYYNMLLAAVRIPCMVGGRSDSRLGQVSSLAYLYCPPYIYFILSMSFGLYLYEYLSRTSVIKSLLNLWAITLSKEKGCFQAKLQVITVVFLLYFYYK